MSKKPTPLSWDDVTATYNECLLTCKGADGVADRLMVLFSGMSEKLQDKHRGAIRNFVTNIRDCIKFAKDELEKIYAQHRSMTGKIMNDDQNMVAITCTMQYSDWVEMAARTLLPQHDICSGIEEPIRADMLAEIEAAKTTQPQSV